MKNKQDIGSFIQQQLEAGTKEMSSDLWERIDATLDRQRKRKRWFLFLIGIPLSVVLALYVFNPQNRIPIPEDTPSKVVTSEEDSNDKSPQFTEELKVTEVHNDSVTITKEISKTNSEEKSITKAVERVNPSSTKRDNRPPLKEIDSIEAFTNDSTATKKTTLHYYNAETKEEFKTQDNTKIDSILQQKKAIKKDSISPKQR